MIQPIFGSNRTLSVSEMLIEADRTATSDADLRVKVSLILEYARAEVLAKSPNAERGEAQTWAKLVAAYRATLPKEAA